jgi:prepilin-type N-terminal cleavage/methylation domain-containing protein
MTPVRRRYVTRQRGFTLVELALVVGIVAILLGGLLVPISRSIEQKAIATTQANLELAQQALLGYALINGSLPCPDAGTDPNTEGKASSADINGCSSISVGRLPWATLGIQGVDGWGNRLDYVVYAPLGASFSKVTDSNLEVWCTKLTTATVPNGIPGCLTTGDAVVKPSLKTSFVVYSRGKNGSGAYRTGGSRNSAPDPALIDETQNHLASGGIFISRSQTDAKSTAGEFDDIMVWMPSTLLTAKLFAAGIWSPSP